jgi:hypothetical protein
MFRLKTLFHEVLKTVCGASQSQTIYKYSEISQLLSEYILANWNELVNPRHFKLAIVSGDLFGTALGVKAFHRCQVASLIKTQLQSFVLGPSTSSSTRREATAKKVRVSKKKKAMEVCDDIDSSDQRPQPGDRKGPEQGTATLNLSLRSGEGQQPASASLEVRLGGDTQGASA